MLTSPLRLLSPSLLTLPLLMLAGCPSPKESATDDSATGADDSDAPDDSTDVDDSGPDDSTTTDDSDPSDSGDVVEYNSLFDETVIHSVVLEIDDAAMQALAAEPEVYTAAIVTIDGVRFENVGLRLRGDTVEHSLVDGKPSLRVKLDEYEKNQDYGDVSRLTLDAMNGDPSQSRVVVAAWLWQQAGIPASRASYTTVDYVLNGETVHLGLYANVETVDGDFADHHFADGSGDLWEGEDMADFTDAGIQNFTLSSGDGEWMNLTTAWQTVWSDPVDDFYTTADEVLQMDGFLDYWAWRIATGAPDGYPYELDDYYIYADPSAGGRLAFAPWDLEKSWDSGMSWDAVSGVVAFKCTRDTVCQGGIVDAVRDALDRYEASAVDIKASELFILTDDELSFDDRRGYTIGEVTSARTQLTYRLSIWPDRVRQDVGI